MNKRWRVNTNCSHNGISFTLYNYCYLSTPPQMEVHVVGSMEYTKEGKTSELISTAGDGHTRVAARLYTKNRTIEKNCLRLCCCLLYSIPPLRIGIFVQQYILIPYTTLYRKSDLCISIIETERPFSQFLDSCIYEQLHIPKIGLPIWLQQK